MTTFPIGEIARRSGYAASALRYYERVGVLPVAVREGGRRRYSQAVFERLAVIDFARETGFTLAEIGLLFADGKAYSARMRTLANQKVRQLDEQIARARAMRTTLRAALRCRCVDVAACGRSLMRHAAAR